MKTRPTRILICTVRGCRCGNKCYVVVRWWNGRLTPFHI